MEFGRNLSNKIFETVEDLQQALTKTLEPYWKEPALEEACRLFVAGRGRRGLMISVSLIGIVGKQGVFEWWQPGQQTGSGRGANQGGRIKLVEPYALHCETVCGWRSADLVPVTSHSVHLGFIGQQEQDIVVPIVKA